MHDPNWRGINRRLVKDEAGQVSKDQSLLGLKSHIWTLRRGHWQVRKILLVSLWREQEGSREPRLGQQDPQEMVVT